MKKYLRRITPLGDRLLAFASIDPAGCWLFNGYRMKNGYGLIGMGRRGEPSILAHRASWAVHRGEIPEGLHVLHRCDVRNCINPDHLFLGTQADNAKDMDSKGRRVTTRQVGESNPFSKLTEAQVREIRAGTKSAASYARKFGVAPITAQQARSGHSWKHLK